RFSGLVETQGLPKRSQPKNTVAKPEETTDPSTSDERSQQRSGATADQDRAFALAAASLRQALQSLPDVAEVSSQVIFERTKDGLNIEIVDHDGRSMFPEGGKEPYERTRRLIQRLAGQIKLLPYRVTITGHTSATRLPSRSGYGAWELSADRANAVRQILDQEGPPAGSLFMVAGKADTRPPLPA